MSSSRIYILLIALVCIVVPHHNAHAVKGQLMAGTAKITITPENPGKPVHDVCYARSLVLDVSGERIAFVSVDLGIYTSENLIKACKEKIRPVTVLSQFLAYSFRPESR